MLQLACGACMWWCLLFSAELTRLTQEYSTRTQLEVFCKDKTSKEDQIRRLWAFCKICHYLRKMYLWLVMQDNTHFVVLYLWKQSLYFCRCKLHTQPVCKTVILSQPRCRLLRQALNSCKVCRNADSDRLLPPIIAYTRSCTSRLAVVSAAVAVFREW